MIQWLLTISVLTPLFSSVINIFFGAKVLGRKAGHFATAAMLASCVCAWTALLSWATGDHSTVVWRIPWLPIGDGQWLVLGLLVDGLGVSMFAMVTLIATLVHLYSIGYMAGDKRYPWFFAYLSLFTFSMLGIVAANSLMQLFVFWELVGLTSYLLIGFWFEKRGPQLACKKAFVMNRVGDMGFLIGFGILFYQLDGNVLLPACEGVTDVGGQKLTSMLGALNTLLAETGHSITNPPWWLTLAGIGLFFGAIGKSAQFPLQTWLPDAMEGPTPVSSIVHSATMVAAGVYLTGRIYAILTPGAHLFIATIGLITLVMAACMALVMTDIKRVLAYSTLSQLGYMVLGLGVGSYTFALFHLITHAFFKCCLFQCSGSVIHAAHHQQDMRYYGGLKDKLPITAACYFVCTLAISGAVIPWTAVGVSGFYSKDGVIAGSVNYGQALGGWANLFWIGPMVIAYVTAFYMARSFALTFLGRPRDQHLYDHAHEAPFTMLFPQVCLALMALLSAPWLIPWFSWIGDSQPSVEYVQTTVATFGDTEHQQMGHGFHAVHTYLLHGLGWIIALGAGLWMYKGGFAISSKLVRIPGVNLLYNWAHNKFYFDALYDTFAVALVKLLSFLAGAFDRNIVDGLVNLVGWLGKLLAWVIGWFDNKVVDGLVNGAATFAQSSGQILRSTQVGRIRVYVLLLMASAAAAIVVVMASVLMM